MKRLAGLNFRDPVAVLLVGAMLVSAAILIALGSRLSFLLDDWVFILYRRGVTADAFLTPDNEHFVAAPVAIYQVLLATVGMDSTLPFRVVSTAMFLTGVGCFFVWIRPRVGAWLALLMTYLVLFLGAAFDDVLWFASITFLGSMACGLGMLLCLERGDRLGDRLACALLTVAMTFSGVWVAFAAGAAVDIALRRPRWRSRAYIVVVPFVLYGLWWLGWGHTAESAISLHNLTTTPRYVFDSIASAIAALLGLATPGWSPAGPSGLDWGRPLVVLAAAFAVWRLRRMASIPRSFWVVFVIGAVFWTLGGLAVKPGRVPYASRYQYPGAVFVLLIAAELMRGIRISRAGLIVTAIAAAAAVTSNLHFLYESYKSYKATSDIERADLGALEIARDKVSPRLLLTPDIANTGYVQVDAGSYLSAVDSFGSPADTPSEIAAAPQAARLAADKVLAAALGVKITQRHQIATAPDPSPRPISLPPETPVPPERCVTVPPTAEGSQVLSLPSGGVIVRSRTGNTVTLRLRRFASTFPVGAGRHTGRLVVAIKIPPDNVPQPWQLKLEALHQVTVCGRSS